MHTTLTIFVICICYSEGFPGGSMVKNLPVNAADAGSIPGLGRSLGEGNGNPLQYSCLGNPMDRGAWRAIVYGATRVRYNLATKSPPTKLSTQFRVIQIMQRISGF